jgi:hypothetical protein
MCLIRNYIIHESLPTHVPPPEAVKDFSKRERIFEQVLEKKMKQHTPDDKSAQIWM